MNLMKYIKHFFIICKHKYYVAQECFKRGLYWQGVIHDLSKFSLEEFLESAKFFQGNGTPIARIKAEQDYSKAWLHHKGRNKHHWQYWTDFYKEEIRPCPIPDKYLIEMACDIIGASKAYGNGTPINYFNKHSPTWLMLEGDKYFVRNLLENYSNKS